MLTEVLMQNYGEKCGGRKKTIRPRGTHHSRDFLLARSNHLLLHASNSSSISLPVWTAAPRPAAPSSAGPGYPNLSTMRQSHRQQRQVLPLLRQSAPIIGPNCSPFPFFFRSSIGCVLFSFGRKNGVGSRVARGK
jgi:hypothetical protein